MYSKKTLKTERKSFSLNQFILESVGTAHIIQPRPGQTLYLIFELFYTTDTLMFIMFLHCCFLI